MTFRSTARTMTPRRIDLLRYIAERIAETGISPTYEEMAEHLGVVSNATVFEHVHSLIALGYLRRVATAVPRNLELTMAGAGRLYPNHVERAAAQLLRESLTLALAESNDEAETRVVMRMLADLGRVAP